MPRHMPIFDEEIPTMRPRIRSAIAVKRSASNLHWFALAASLTALFFI